MGMYLFNADLVKQISPPFPPTDRLKAISMGSVRPQSFKSVFRELNNLSPYQLRGMYGINGKQLQWEGGKDLGKRLGRRQKAVVNGKVSE